MKSANELVEELNSLKNRVKPGGLQVEYRHYRFNDFVPFKNGNGMDGQIVPFNMGGYTLAYIIDGDVAHIGIAKCSEKENFNKNTGRIIAASKAIENPVTIHLNNLNYLLDFGTCAYDFWSYCEVVKFVQEAIYGKDRYKSK